MWKKIEDYNYSVSEDGEVRNDKTGRILKQKKNTVGYFQVVLHKDGKPKWLLVHRLVGYAFLDLKHDELVDHIDGNKEYNSVFNLRPCTQKQNQQNRKNVKGYCWCKLMNKWKAHICIDRKNKHLGFFNTEEEARNAYLEAKKIYHTF